MENADKKEKTSEKEERIRKITFLYYSRPDIQNAIFSFSSHRETVPRYFEGFGKRPDGLNYPSEVFQSAKNGATSFHCSEELWQDPLKISTGMNETEMNTIRIGWDLLIDIDSKYLDYSKVMAEEVIKFLKNHSIYNIGLKFSGSKGFHLIIPWKAIPKEINQIKTSDMFPKWPRIITQYILENIRNKVTERINQLNYSELYPNIAQYIKREGGQISNKSSKNIEIFTSGGSSKTLSKSEYVQMENLKKSEESSTKEVIPDMILVSPRHLFRAPYSLHEKTALASVVLNPEDIRNFHPRDADPMKAVPRDFIPDSKEGEASRLLLQALDWHKENNLDETENSKKYESKSYQPIKLEKISDEFFPPSIKKILEGLQDGRKRALFVLINLFRVIGMERQELEQRIYDWNAKNSVPLKEGYIKAQILWSYRNKIVPPPNYDKDYYKGIGVIPTEEELRMKNPVNYVVRKTLGNRRNDDNLKKVDKRKGYKKQ